MADSEELRNLLRSADRNKDSATPLKAKHAPSSDKDLQDLASLIGSLDIDLNKSVMKDAKPLLSYDQRSETGSQISAASSFRWKPDSSFDGDESFASQQEYQFLASKGHQSTNDIEDYTVIKFGARCMLRGKLGKYLTASVEEVAPNTNTSSTNKMSASTAQHPSRVFNLGVEGQGVGDPMDCICFTNIDNKDDSGPLRYGMTVAIKAPSAKERLLGLRDGTRLGFWRNLIGQGEKWQVLKASASQLSSYGGGGHTGLGNGTSSVSLSGIGSGMLGMNATSRGCEEIEARGKYVRTGDAILLQTYKSDHLLSLHEALYGPEVKLVFRDRAGLGSEVWQLEQFNSVGLPAWYLNRPYLSGQYLVLPTAMKTPSLDIQARAFPQATLMMQQQQSSQSSPSPAALNTLTPQSQQFLLMRDLLQVLAGVEGQYIRVAAAIAASTSANNAPAAGVSGASGADGASANLAAENALNQSAASVLERRRLGGSASLQRGSFSSAAGAGGGGGVSGQVGGAGTGGVAGGLPKVSEAHFVIDLDSADRSAANQVTQLLPICESAVRVREFIRLHSRYEFGLVSHALCAALRKILREFDVLVAQLEASFAQGKLSLQKMVYLLQPSKVTLRLLEKLCLRLKNIVGGQMVDVLHAVMLEQGDVKSRELHLHLLMCAAEPFVNTLATWIFRGVLSDPYGEFMVEEDRSLTKEALVEDFNARYWDNRYTLCEKHIPTILRSYALKALTAGKYLSVVLDCAGDMGALGTTRNHADADFTQHQLTLFGAAGNTAFGAALKGIVLPKVRKLQLSLEVADSALSQAIHEAYVLSSRALLKILDARGLRSHMISLRRFFLLEHGDFFTQFMDTAEEELRREAKDVVLGRVQVLLQSAVQTSTLVNDPHKEDLTCSLASHNLIQHLHLIQSAGEANSDAYASLSSQGLKGVEAFTLDYKVAWPTSIVLSRRAITKYQLLSRLLYFSKHVERRVLVSWVGHQSTKELNVRGAMGPAYCLRHRMLHFLQNFVYYMTLEVIGPRGHELEGLLDKAEDLDEVMELHERFLDTCLKECLLASQDLLKILTKIMTTCLLFADQMQRFTLDSVHHHGKDSVGHASSGRVGTMRRSGARSHASAAGEQAAQAERQNRLRESSEFIQKESSHESFTRILNKFGETFDAQLKEFLDKLWTNNYRHHVQLSNLCVRLDYNGFYSSQFASNE